MAIEETTRLGLTTYTSGSDFHPQRTDFNQRMQLLDELAAIVEQGAHADRPMPETMGRLWMSTDTEELYYDTGTTWVRVVRIGSGGAGEDVVVDGTASEGSSNRAARADHTHNLPLATASAPGAMSAADKADIDDAASADMPSTLVRRDGSGRTGVNDPDMGVHAANKRYVDDAVADAVSDKVTEMGRLGTSDLDTVIEGGIYYARGDDVDTARNYPRSAPAGVLTVKELGSTKHQMWQEYNGVTFTRSRNDAGDWNDWVQYADMSTATSSADGLMSATDKEFLDTATSTRDPDSLVKRSGEGVFSADDPIGDHNVANKRYVDGEIATRAPVSHTHDAADVDAGTLDPARLPAATQDDQGALSPADKTALDGMLTVINAPLASWSGNSGDDTKARILMGDIAVVTIYLSGVDLPSGVQSTVIARLISELSPASNNEQFSAWVDNGVGTATGLVRLNGDVEIRWSNGAISSGIIIVNLTYIIS